jgi:hypothetical protein
VIESDLKIRDCAAGTQERETNAQAAKSEGDSWSNPMHWSRSSEIPKGLGRTVTPPARHVSGLQPTNDVDADLLGQRLGLRKAVH